MNMREPPLRLTQAQARTVLASLRATADSHGWGLLACAVMSNHVHVVLGVPGDPDPADLLRDLKRSASAAVNRTHSGPRRKWWTRSGSRRRLHAEPHVIAAIAYVRRQHQPLAFWHGGTFDE